MEGTLFGFTEEQLADFGRRTQLQLGRRQGGGQDKKKGGKGEMAGHAAILRVAGQDGAGKRAVAKMLGQITELC